MNANDKWKKENTVTITLRFNKKTDEEIVKWITNLKKEKKSVQGEIKKLIKKHLENY